MICKDCAWEADANARLEAAGTPDRRYVATMAQQLRCQVCLEPVKPVGYCIAVDHNDCPGSGKLMKPTGHKACVGCDCQHRRKT